MVRISVINRGNGLRERCEVFCGIFLREFGESSPLKRLGVSIVTCSCGIMYFPYLTLLVCYLCS